MDVCKCIVPSRHWGTINIRRVLSSGWGKGKRGGRPLATPCVLPQNWGGNEPNLTVTCLVLKATANDKRHLALCHDDFRGPRSDLCRSGWKSYPMHLRKNEQLDQECCLCIAEGRCNLVIMVMYSCPALTSPEFKC
ncbi:uncharacterized protein TNCV_160221 [Trichonephila clavipes]|nr:uncharacterized protein TNCV_160221 [Trichonephila clavipes]